MSSFAWLTCKAFIERQTPERQKRLVNYLPKSQRETLTSLRFSSNQWIDKPIHIDEALDTVHPSWILPHIQTSTPQELGFLLAALKSHQASALKTQLRFLRPLPTLTPLGKAYLRDDLLKKIVGTETVIPLNALMESPLNALATISFKDLIQLDFLLGLKDLSQYLKIVIDKTKLRNLEAALTPNEWRTAQQYSSKKDPLAGGRESFDAWDGNPEKLRSIIEQRGINRLAKALYGEHPSLLWYVTHIFDMQRASFFQKLCTEIPTKTTHDFLREQVLETLNTLHKT